MSIFLKTSSALIILLAFTMIGVDPYGKSGHLHACANNRNKLLSILNILCNNTQNITITTRDACYGCFFRAGGLPSGNTQLVALSQCATIYLNQTTYQVCAQQLQSVVNGYRPTPTNLATSAAGCYQGYCEFVRCVRRTNANMLIDNCVLSQLGNRDLNRMADRVALFSNATSCVLSRARCSAYNPITGELQTVTPQRPASVAVRASYNALQITPNGEIRIVRFAGTTGVAEFFCSSRSTLEQHSYDMADC